MGMDVRRLTDEEHLEPGSLILLYTDGLTDVINVERKKFGEKRMMGAALQAMKLDAQPEPFIGNMMEAVDRYAGGMEQDDDISMLAIRYTKG